MVWSVILKYHVCVYLVIEAAFGENEPRLLCA